MTVPTKTPQAWAHAHQAVEPLYTHDGRVATRTANGNTLLVVHCPECHWVGWKAANK